MTPTDAVAREAGLAALKQFPVLDGRVIRLHSDAVIDAYLITALEGADGKLRAIAKAHDVDAATFAENPLTQSSNSTENWLRSKNADVGELLTLVTALSAKLKEVEGRNAEILRADASIVSEAERLTAQKAAHAKLLRDEADEIKVRGESSDGPQRDDWQRGYKSASADAYSCLRRLADRIEGGE